MSKPIVVIGSGLAAYLFAQEFRKLDKERSLIIVTKSDGRFYSKPLLSTALTQKKTVEALALSDAQSMSKKLSATILTNAEVTAIDSQKKTITYCDADDKKQLEYGDLVLACGANKNTLSIEGDAVDDIQSVNNIEDYERFRHWLDGKKYIGIVGAGFVGCEFANDLINAGYQVSMIASETHPLARLIPERIGKVLLDMFSEQGVQWVLGHFVKRVDRSGEAYSIFLDNQLEVKADGVMSAIGIRPNLGLAESAGIKTHLGIVVDSQLRSSDPNIYALGDCAEVNGECRQYVAPILQGARTLAKVLNHEKLASLQYPVMPIVIKTPLCPLVLVPPPEAVSGQWIYEGDGCDIKAVFQDEGDQIYGFILTGSAVRDRVDLVKQLKLVQA